MNRQLVSALIVLLTIPFLFLTSEALSAAEKETLQLQVKEMNAEGLTLQYNMSDFNADLLDSSSGSYMLVQTAEGHEVPTMTKYIAVPAGCRANVKISDRRSYQRQIGNSQLNLEGALLTEEQLKSNRLDPAVPVFVSDIEIFRGVPVASLSLFPVQYNTENNEIIENRSFEVEISFEPDPTVPVSKRVKTRPGTEMARLMDQMILNLPQRDPDYAEMQQSNRGRILILHQDDEGFIENDLPHVERLAEWKREMGYFVEVVGVNVIVQQGGLTAQDIKSDIIYPRYVDEENPLDYLILVGADTLTGEAFYFPKYRPRNGEAGDHFYTVLDNAEQYLSDIAVGRLFVNNTDELAAVITRTILYEREPYIENEDWFSKGMYTAENIAAFGGQFVPSMIHLGRWFSDQMRQAGYDSFDTLYADAHNEQFNQVVREKLEEGRSIALSRGWLEGCNLEDEGPAETGRKNPFVMAITCLSQETQSGFYRFSDRENSGPIATAVNHGLSHSIGNNSILGGAVLAITDFKLHKAGLIQNYSKYQFWSDTRHEPPEWGMDNIAIFRLMGDPTVEIFTDRPIELEASHPAEISIGERGLTVEVTYGGNPVADAWVSVWQEDRWQYVAQPGEDGFARFTFSEADLDAGSLDICITRYNAIPYIASVDIVQADNRLDFSAVEFDTDNGMTGIVPTVVTLVNSGNDDLSNLTAYLSSEDELVSISPAEIQIGQVARNAETELDFDIEFDGSSRSGRQVRIQVEISDGENTWEHAFQFETSGHNLHKNRPGFPDNDFGPGQLVRMVLELSNSGNLTAPAMTAVLESLHPYVNVIAGNVQYPAIGSGNVANPQAGTFRVEASTLAIAGNMAQFRLILEAQDEQNPFHDTLYFEEMIGVPNPSDPYGPDDYGYIVFDSSDEDWIKHPVYEWIEINPSKGGPEDAVKLELEDYHVDADSTIAVRLPFSFGYYGEHFDTLAVCSNGWIAFGAEQTKYIDFRNQQIPGIQGPDAMVAVFWQDLINPVPDNRGVFTYYDEDRGYFIIEWSELKINADANTDNNTNLIEFQAILLDPARFPTSTGDGEIKLQYKTVAILPGDTWDNHYFTIGIRNLDGTDGLEYCYWQVYPNANRQIENEMALLFTPNRITEFGSLLGRITHRSNPNQGIAGVNVLSLNSGASGVTGQDGSYTIDRIPIGDDNIRVSKNGYNSEIVAVEIFVDQSLTLDTSLTHPVIVASNEAIETSLNGGPNITNLDYGIENTGDGPLEFKLTRSYPDGSGTQYAKVFHHDVSADVDDNYLYGCQFVGDTIYVSGSGLRNETGDEMIYVYGPEGNLVRSFPQPSTTDRGFKDLAWDGTYLYGGEAREFGDDSSAAAIVGFDLTGAVHHVIVLPAEADSSLTEPWALAYNPNNGSFLTTNNEKDIFVINRDGEIIDRFSVNIAGISLTMRGLAWYQDDEDGMQLYIVNQPGNDGMVLLKLDVETHLARVVRNLTEYPGDRPMSLSIGYDWDLSTISLGLIKNGGGNNDHDTLRVYEIGPDTHFLTFNPSEGEIPGGEGSVVNLEMRGDNLSVTGVYEFGIVVRHNAEGESIVIPVTLNVLPVSIDDEGITVPTRFALEQAYPNPFNNSTRISFSLAENAMTRLIVYDIAGRQVAELVNREMTQGRYNLAFSPETLASGIYFYRLQSGGESLVKRLVYLR